MAKGLKRICLLCLAMLCLAGCSTSQKDSQSGTQQSVAPSATLAYPQASLPAPSFSEEEKKAAELPDDLPEESLRSMVYTMANPDVDIMLSVPAYWQRLQPEGAREDQIYFFLRADQTYITSFSISSHEETVKGYEEESKILSYVEGQWKEYKALMEDNGYVVENAEKIKSIKVGECIGGDIRFEIVDKDELRTINHLIIWATEDRVYWCTLCSKTEYWEYAESSLMEMLEGFSTLSALRN